MLRCRGNFLKKFPHLQKLSILGMDLDLYGSSKITDTLHKPPSEREGDRAFAVEGANGMNDL